MSKFWNEDRYEIILSLICHMKGIKREEFFTLLKDQQFKYVTLLLLKKYNCLDEEKLHKDFLDENKRLVSKGYKKAEEKLLVNKEFRNKYFQIEEQIEKML